MNVKQIKMCALYLNLFSEFRVGIEQTIHSFLFIFITFPPSVRAGMLAASKKRLWIVSLFSLGFTNPVRWVSDERRSSDGLLRRARRTGCQASRPTNAVTVCANWLCSKQIAYWLGLEMLDPFRTMICNLQVVSHKRDLDRVNISILEKKMHFYDHRFAKSST